MALGGRNIKEAINISVCDGESNFLMEGQFVHEGEDEKTG